MGAAGSAAASLRRRSAMSLCAKITRSAWLWRMPSIIEAWLSASENTMQPGRRDASVDSAARLDT